VLLDQEVTATALKAHPYRNPTIGWLSDLQRMTRDDLYGHYRRYYLPNNATLVIVGDVDADDALRRVEKHFGSIPRGAVPGRHWTAEPEQTGERRVTIRREGTTAYFKVAYHAPAATEAGFFPALVLDAVLTGAKGVNLWSSFRGAPPQRQSRLYRALVDRRLASMVAGQIVPTAEPFLYTVSATATDGTPLGAVESALLHELDAVRANGITPAELTRAKKQLHARLVFDNDSVTNIAHQIGYFETIAGVDVFASVDDRVQAVTLEAVSNVAAAMLAPANRTIGWFEPVGDAPAAPDPVGR
jgi:zinc protease